MLAHRWDFEQLRVLDLFAGSGAVSLEFGSRGCPEITSVDQHPGCVAYIRRMSQELNLPIRPYRAEVFGFLKKWKREEAFDLVFADPPYRFPEEKTAALSELVWEARILGPDGILILEHPVQYSLDQLDRFHSCRDYGSSRFSFLGKWDGGDTEDSPF